MDHTAAEVTTTTTEERPQLPILQSVPAILHDLACIIGTDGVLRHLSGGLLGYSAGELEGSHLREMVHPDELQETERALQSLAQEVPLVAFRNRCRSKDGSYLWLEWKATATESGICAVARDASAQVRREEEVRDRERQVCESCSEERFRLAMEATNDGLWDVELQTEKSYFSPGCYRMLGYDPEAEQLTLKEWLDLVHPEDLERTRSASQECIEKGMPEFEVEVRVQAKNGGWKWLLNRGKAVSRDGNGRARRIVGTVQDISRRKMTEEMLRMEHGLLNLITLTSPIGIISVDRDGRIPFVNPRLEEITGLSGEEIISRGCYSREWRITSRDGTALAQPGLPISRVMETGQAQLDSSFYLERPDGRRVLLSVNAAPLVDLEGGNGGVVATVEDITERTNAEQRMAESEWLLRESQRIAQLGTFVFDVESDTWQGSAKFEEITGTGPAYPRTLAAYLQIVHPDYRDIFLENITDSIEQGKLFELEYKVVRPSDGAERWLAAFAEPISRENSVVRRVIGAIQDITERKSAEDAIRSLNEELDMRVMERTAQLNAANREMETFSYSVSHDLRAPLRHINSYCSMLTEDFQQWLPQQASYYLERICAASSRMGKLIDDLLILSRVNRAEMKQVNFKISKMALEVAEMLCEGAPERTVEFVVAEGLSARGDRVLVRQVLENLMGNAMKYSARHDGARVEFGKTLIDGRSVFFVRDDGAGFDMAYADKLFQPFQRLHGAEFEGTGIGLATVKRIIERHGGRVWAKGEVDRGATFYFTLPGAAGKTAERPGPL